jgi:inorganic triphosphatase YgiF
VPAAKRRVAAANDNIDGGQCSERVRLSRHPRRFTRHTPAGEVVIGYLNAQAARLGSLDMAVRRDKPDAVHQMRVTVRRLRSTLQSFTAVVSGPDTKRAARRAEVARARAPGG